jgi:endoribonuclease Dicer
VGTSVIEEGFNVPECNVVIRLDAPSTVTALIQSRGRLRHKNSKFIGIVKSEKHTYEKLLQQESFLKTAVHLLLQEGELNLDRLSPDDKKKVTAEWKYGMI